MLGTITITITQKQINFLAPPIPSDVSQLTQLGAFLLNLVAF
jgi:hypothetical protein